MSLATARTGAVAFIQRFGSALNLNMHFHMLFLDGVSVTRCNDGDSGNSGHKQPGGTCKSQKQVFMFGHP